MARLKVFDTNAMIALSKGSLSGIPVETKVAISIITRIELLAWPELSAEQRRNVQGMVDSVETVHITPKVESAVVMVRLQKILKLPDAIVAGTALALGAPLVTNDKTFTRVANLRVETF